MKILPKFEIYLYFFVWISSNIFTLYKLIRAQNELLQNYNKDEILSPGWSFISEYKDESDLEWTTWKYLHNLTWFYLVIQFIVTELIRDQSPALIHYCRIISSITFITYYLGLNHLIFIVSQPVIFCTVLYFNGTKAFLWITSLILLSTYNSLKNFEIFWKIFDNEDLADSEVYILLIGLGWTALKCISFSLEYIERKKICKEKDVEPFNKTTLDMFSYVLYLPTLYTGPVIMYNDYEQSLYRKTPLMLRLRRFLVDIIIFTIYIAMLDLACHYIYFIAMESKIWLISQLPSIALCGGGLWMGLHFFIKYVIMYGISGAFCSLDNIEPPPTPRCIARIHVYSQMWRFFDVGLYRFLIKYIYKPSLILITTYIHIPSSLQKLLASSTTFLFIFFWHGTTNGILVWAFLNYLGITCERFGEMTSNTELYQQFKDKVLKTKAMEQRFKAAICTPLLIMSALSNFFLFGGFRVGMVYVKIFMKSFSWISLYVLLCLYSCCHVSMMLENVHSRTTNRYKIY